MQRYLPWVVQVWHSHLQKLCVCCITLHHIAITWCKASGMSFGSLWWVMTPYQVLLMWMSHGCGLPEVWGHLQLSQLGVNPLLLTRYSTQPKPLPSPILAGGNVWPNLASADGPVGCGFPTLNTATAHLQENCWVWLSCGYILLPQSCSLLSRPETSGQ